MAELLRSSFGAALGILLLAAAARGGADDPPPPVWPGRFHAMASQIREGDLGVVDLWYDYAAGHNLNVIQTQSGEEDGPLFDNEWGNGTTYYYLPAKAKSKYCDVVDFGVGIIKPNWLDGATYLGEETSGIYDCYKWEQGEIPEAHARFLGLRPDSNAQVRSLADDQRDSTSNMAATWKKEEGSGGGGGRSATSPLSSLRGQQQGPERGREHDEIDRTASQSKTEGKFITYWSEKKTDRPVKWLFFDDAEFQVIRFDPGATMKDEMFQIPDYCFSGDVSDEDEAFDVQ